MSNHTNLTIEKNVSLARYTTFGIGGPAEYFAVCNTTEELTALAGFARERGLTVTILGGGSNVLISDAGVTGLVIKNNIGNIKVVENGGAVIVTAGAGVVWDDLVSYTVAKNYWGLENLSAIPGSVGATPIQNVGAYGVEVGELVETVEVYDINKNIFLNIKHDECQFGYRDSIFKTKVGKNLIVTAVSYKLSLTPNPKLHYKDLALKFGMEQDETSLPSLKDIREAVIEIRSSKFPDWRERGTVGSFFKNPIITTLEYDRLVHLYEDLPGFSVGGHKIKVPLGWILDKVCNLRGVKEGNVGTYQNQSLVMINYGNATAKEVESFAKKISDCVLEKTNIVVEWEANKI